MYHEETWRPVDTAHAAELITNLSRRIEKELQGRGYESPDLRVRTVLEEAVLNAWIHGNKQDTGKSVVVRWQYGDEFLLEVIDEGDGFDFECPPDPTTSENITKSCGRGIFIIKHFADCVDWKNGGKHLIAIFEK